MPGTASHAKRDLQCHNQVSDPLACYKHMFEYKNQVCVTPVTASSHLKSKNSQNETTKLQEPDFRPDRQKLNSSFCLFVFVFGDHSW